MIQFCGGFVSGQTRDRWEKPETESREIEKVKKVEKVVVPENGKWKLSLFPCNS